MGMVFRRWLVFVLCLVTALTPLQGFANEQLTLAQAVADEDTPAAKNALERGENPNGIDPFLNHTPLHVAVAPGGPRSSGMVQLLAQYKVNLDQEDAATQLTPLMASMIVRDTGPFAVVEKTRATVLFHLLLDLGADPNAATLSGVTPLMLATEIGNPEYVKKLLGRGANPNAQDVNGQTALHAAYAQFGPPGQAQGNTNAEAVKEALLQAGADVSIKNRSGLKPGEKPLVASQPSTSAKAEPTAEPASAPAPSAPNIAAVEPVAAPEKSPWSKWLIGGAIAAAAVVGGIVLAAALDDQKKQAAANAAANALASSTNNATPGKQPVPGQGSATVTWETTKVSDALQYHQMKLCFDASTCVPVGRRVRQDVAKAVFLTSASGDVGTGWVRGAPLYPSELFPLSRGFNGALVVAYSGKTRPSNAQVTNMLSDALAKADNAVTAVDLANQYAQQLSGVAANPINPGIFSIRPTFQWEYTIGPIRSYVLKLCMGGSSCKGLGEPILVDANPNDGMTSQGFANGIRWSASSPVKLSMLDDLRNRLSEVIGKVWTGRPTPSFDVVANVLNMALASGSSPANVADLALSYFARRGFTGASTTTPTNIATSNSACNAPYVGPLDDPQTSTFCRQAYSYSCIGNTVNAGKVCTLLNSTLSALGSPQTAAQYCPNYCR